MVVGAQAWRVTCAFWRGVCSFSRGCALRRGRGGRGTRVLRGLGSGVLCQFSMVFLVVRRGVGPEKGMVLFRPDCPPFGYPQKGRTAWTSMWGRWNQFLFPTLLHKTLRAERKVGAL